MQKYEDLRPSQEKDLIRLQQWLLATMATGWQFFRSALRLPRRIGTGSCPLEAWAVQAGFRARPDPARPAQHGTRACQAPKRGRTSPRTGTRSAKRSVSCPPAGFGAGARSIASPEPVESHWASSSPGASHETLLGTYPMPAALPFVCRRSFERGAQQHN